MDADAQRPVTIHLWKPNKNRSSLHQARYKPSCRFKPSSMNEEADLIQLLPEQIKLRNLEFDSDGRLKPRDREHFKRYLAKHAIGPQASPTKERITTDTSAEASTVTRNYTSFSRKPTRSRAEGHDEARAVRAERKSGSPVAQRTRHNSRYHL